MQSLHHRWWYGIKIIIVTINKPLPRNSCLTNISLTPIAPNHPKLHKFPLKPNPTWSSLSLLLLLQSVSLYSPCPMDSLLLRLPNKSTNQSRWRPTSLGSMHGRAKLGQDLTVFWKPLITTISNAKTPFGGHYLEIDDHHSLLTSLKKSSTSFAPRIYTSLSPIIVAVVALLIGRVPIALLFGRVLV